MMTRGGARDGAGRPKKETTTRVTVVFDIDDWEEVKRVAKLQKITASEFVRQRVVESIRPSVR